MRQETWLETEVQSQAKTQAVRSKSDIKQSAQGGKGGQGRKRDPNLDNEAVKKYREIVHLQANYLQREEIALTVGNERVWEAVLLEWMLEGKNPKNVLGMLRIYQNMMPSR